MPAASKAEQAAVAIALKNPEKLYGKNKGLLKMTPKQLTDFAKTPTAGLPEHTPKVIQPKHWSGK